MGELHMRGLHRFWEETVSSLMGTTPGWEQARREADLTIELPNGGDPMFFRRIEPGEFLMGSREGSPYEQPRHRVRITREFYMASLLVTQAQFRIWIEERGVEHRDFCKGNGRLPADSVPLDWALDFCGWLSDSGCLPDGFVATLPSEAQWEYACRAGSDGEYSSGDGAVALAEVGWFDGNSEDTTHPVGELAANAWGLYDMHGNVWERCRDSFNKGAYRMTLDGLKDPEMKATDRKGIDSNVLRGGSCVTAFSMCSSAYRFSARRSERNGHSGFRICLLHRLDPPGRERFAFREATTGVAEVDVAEVCMDSDSRNCRKQARPTGARPTPDIEMGSSNGGAEAPQDDSLSCALLAEPCRDETCGRTPAGAEIHGRSAPEEKGPAGVPPRSGGDVE